MRRLGSIVAVVGFALAASAHAQVRGPLTPAGCLHLSGRGEVRVEGRLLVRTFPGPPDFESVAAGDEAERTYLLKLPRPICLDDDGQFADPAKRFDQVQVSTTAAGLWPKLRSAVGHTVVVSGEAFAAFDGHHHAPLVVLATHLTSDRRTSRPSRR